MAAPRAKNRSEDQAVETLSPDDELRDRLRALGYAQ